MLVLRRGERVMDFFDPPAIDLFYQLTCGPRTGPALPTLRQDSEKDRKEAADGDALTDPYSYAEREACRAQK